jgi:adenylosuccinate lyase
MIDRYTRPEMGRIWTLENRYRAWLEVELAVCEAWSRLGRIPEEALAEIRSKADFDLSRILEIEERTRHDVIAFLTAVEERVGPASRFIHLGCTSSDITDTAIGLLLTRAGSLILDGLDGLLAVLRKMAFAHKGVIVIGRTHGVHAEPTSFGLKIAGFHAEFARHRERVRDAVENIRYGKISGAVGTYSELDPRVEAMALDLLGLKVEPHSTQIVQRDRHAHYFTALALLAGGIERLAVELRHLQRTEVLEVEEGFAKGQKGSSAMPHKRNPVSAENLAGLARLVRANALAAMENMALWHERDISHSSVERVIMPDSTILADYMLARLTGLLANLRVLPENMLRNLGASHRLFFSQRLLHALLGAGMARQEAYELVQEVAMRCWTAKKDFPAEAAAEERIASRLGQARLAEVFDTAAYLAHEDLIFARVFGEEAE